MRWGRDTDGGDSGCPGSGGCGRARPLPAPGRRAGLEGRGRAAQRAACVPAGLSAGGVGGGPGPGSSRLGGWRSGAAGLKVRQAAGWARGGLRAAPWLRAAGGKDLPGASSSLSRERPRRQGCPYGPAEGRRGLRGILNRRGSFSCLWQSGALGSGARLVPETWKGRWACSAAENLVEPVDA